ncbi:MAG: ABC transporter permease [Actinobacteria bacterium]|nr:ABC transporter permease [Actinomycetota bacterium]
MTVGKQTTEPGVEREAGGAPAPARRKLITVLGLDRFSGLYVWAALILIFSLWVPNLFDTTGNARIIAGSQAITAMVAMGLIVPVACGAFDLSIAGTLGVSVCVVIWFQANHHGWGLGILVALLVGLAVGLVNAFIVVRLHVDSFIGTLGMSSILLAGTEWITGGGQIANGVSPSFTAIGQNQVWGLPLPVFYMIALAIVLWWLLEYTPAGRYLYGIGGNPQAARLAGIRVGRITTQAFVLSGLVAAFSGVVLAAQLGSASPDVGGPYLLPAFSAVFLGATQVFPGRVNVPGTLIAIFLLATGVKGLQLAGAPAYINDLFNGAALIIAVALAARAYASQRKA